MPGLVSYSVLRIPANKAYDRHPIADLGDHFAALLIPDGTNAQIRIGSPSADLIPLQYANLLENCQQWGAVYLDADAADDTSQEFIIVIGNGCKIVGSITDRANRSLGVVSVRASDDITGGGTVTAGAAAAALPSRVCRAVQLQADPSNTANIKVGGSDAQSIVLEPGQSHPMPVQNQNQVYYVRAAAGTVELNYLPFS